MSQENVEIVRRVLGAMSVDATDHGTVDAFVDRLVPDIEFEEDPRFPEAGTYRGRSEVRRYFRQFSAEFDRFHFTVEDVVEAGEDAVLVCLRIRGRGKDSGAEFDLRSGWVYTVRDRR